MSISRLGYSRTPSPENVRTGFTFQNSVRRHASTFTGTFTQLRQSGRPAGNRTFKIIITKRTDISCPRVPPPAMQEHDQPTCRQGRRRLTNREWQPFSSCSSQWPVRARVPPARVAASNQLLGDAHFAAGRKNERRHVRLPGSWSVCGRWRSMAGNGTSLPTLSTARRRRSVCVSILLWIVTQNGSSSDTVETISIRLELDGGNEPHT